MRWHEFIFSDKRQTRLLRHFLFWTLWWIYFYGTRFFYPKAFLPGHKAVSKMRADNVQNTFRHYGDYVAGTHVWSLTELLRSLCMLSIHIAACYVVIYYLLPRFLVKAKYFSFVAAGILLIGIMVIASRFMDTVIVPAITQQAGVTIPFYASIFSGVVNALIIIAVASTLKFGKYWWQKQKEKEQLERERINTELRLLKAQIRPGFLFNSLNNIYEFSVTTSPRAPELLLKLSGLLSYMLYECEKPFVPLEKEIAMMKDYMSLEKIRLEEAIEMEISVSGDMSGKTIAPFLLLPFIENSFKQCSDLSKDNWINMDISMEEDYFCMRLANGMMPGPGDQHDGLSNNLANVQKRLTLLYPQKHELKISHEPEMLIVLLKIQIGATLLENGQGEKIIGANPPTKLPYIYAAQ